MQNRIVSQIYYYILLFDFSRDKGKPGVVLAFT